MEVNGKTVLIAPDVMPVLDVSALRHCEHLAGSGWCGCSRDFALRQAPPKPDGVAEMYETLLQCHQPTCLEREIWSHTPVSGETVPRACTQPGCTFAH